VSAGANVSAGAKQAGRPRPQSNQRTRFKKPRAVRGNILQIHGFWRATRWCAPLIAPGRSWGSRQRRTLRTRRHEQEGAPDDARPNSLNRALDAVPTTKKITGVAAVVEIVAYADEHAAIAGHAVADRARAPTRPTAAKLTAGKRGGMQAHSSGGDWLARLIVRTGPTGLGSCVCVCVCVCSIRVRGRGRWPRLVVSGWWCGGGG
jgi:hypothetical protein